MGGAQSLQPIFCIVCQSSMPLCRSIRIAVTGRIFSGHKAISESFSVVSALLSRSPLSSRARRYRNALESLLPSLSLKPSLFSITSLRVVRLNSSHHWRHSLRTSTFALLSLSTCSGLYKVSSCLEASPCKVPPPVCLRISI